MQISSFMYMWLGTKQNTNAKFEMFKEQEQNG